MAEPPSREPPPHATAAEGLPGWARHWHRYRHLVAVASFALGLASLLLIERAERVAQGMVILLPLSWLAMLGDGWFERLARRNRRLRLSPLVLRYAMQALHQESLFFALPFIVACTTWSSSQALFVALLGVAALGSMIDPFYYGWIVPRRWAYLGFHALSVFVTVLTAAPMLWHLTSDESLRLAIGCMAVLSVPSLAHLIDREQLLHWLALFAGVAGLAAAAWTGRAAIPPAPLWVAQAYPSQQVSVEAKTAVQAGPVLSEAAVRERGLYVWTAIRAPRGVRERIVHRWRHEGVEVDHIAIDILGGREEGYRAWSHKRALGAEPQGAWQVRIETEAGQLLGVVRFRVD